MSNVRSDLVRRHYSLAQGRPSPRMPDLTVTELPSQEHARFAPNLYDKGRNMPPRQEIFAPSKVSPRPSIDADLYR